MGSTELMRLDCPVRCHASQHEALAQASCGPQGWSAGALFLGVGGPLVGLF